MRFITNWVRVYDQVKQKIIGKPIGLYLYRDGFGWVGSSDSNLKSNKLPVSEIDLLNHLRQVPVKTWEWIKDSTFIYTVDQNNDTTYTAILDTLTRNRWLGPMAQDFYREFPLGIPDSTKLCTSVMEGAMMASIQALANITDTLRGGISNNWNKFGDSIAGSEFFGTTNQQPIIIKTNSAERIRITDNQITFNFAGTSSDTTLNNAAYKLFSDNSQNTGVFLAGGESGWRTISDRNKKENFEQVDEIKILESIDRIPVSTWNYKNAPENIRYIGPMAQDIYKEFKLGGNDSLSINSVIFDGINFAGLKALNQKTNELRNEFDSFRDTIKCISDACDRIKQLEEEIKNLKNSLDSLKSQGLTMPLKDFNSVRVIQEAHFNDIILEQNNPNPFAESTEIYYYIPAKYGGLAELVLTDESGAQVLIQREICQGRPCNENISAKGLQTGVFLYGIKINGELVKFRKMMVIK